MKKKIFIVLFWLWSVLINILFLPALFMPRQLVVIGQTIWAIGINFLLKYILNITYEIEGSENLPPKPYILAIKHQSIWDTIILHIIENDPAIVMKKELLAIPIYGWYCKKSGMIPIDRSSGIKALKFMLKKSLNAVKENRNIIIFPQGTRIPPGEIAPYLPGVYVLYNKLNLTVVPCTLNSGLIWPSKGWPKTSGIITLKYLNPIKTGLKKNEFLDTLKINIEESSKELLNKN